MSGYYPRSLLASLVSLALFSGSALSTSFTVADGDTLNGRQTLTGNEQGTIGVNATLQQGSNQAIRWSEAQAGTVVIDNSGSIKATSGARAIDTQGNSGTAAHHILLENRQDAVIDSDDDAFRINFNSGLIGTATINNAGSIASAQGQAIDFARLKAGTVLINNNAGAVIRSAQHDAIRTGNAASVTLNNAGSIVTEGAARRALDITGDGGARHISINNAATGVIRSQNDAVRVNYDLTAGSVQLDNAGVIETTGLGDNAGQAVDFNSVSGSAVSTVVTNRSGGVIRSADADAVRAGGDGLVINAGLISAGGAGRVDGASSTSADGVDFQDYNGRVENLAGGRIEGARHGVTGNGFIEVVNQAGGEIVGYNGSGVNLDGNGRVVNYGVISGRYNSLLDIGDGDGVDIDYIGDIDNYGLIEGIGAAGEKNGDPNRADGIAMGGGTIRNRAGATIYSSDRGILVDDSDGGAAFSATQLVNEGRIDALNEGVQLRGNWNDTLVNKGQIISRNNGVAIDMGAGNDLLELHAGSQVQGSIVGGAGHNTLLLTGNGTGHFGAVSQFQQWQVQQGQWQMAADLQILQDELLQISHGARLSIAGQADIDGILQFDLLAEPSALLFDVAGELSFSDDSQFILNLAQWLPTTDQVFELFSAGAVLGLTDDRFSITGLAQGLGYQLFSRWYDNKQIFAVSFSRSATVSAPTTAGSLLLGLFALMAIRRKYCHRQ